MPDPSDRVFYNLVDVFLTRDVTVSIDKGASLKINGTFTLNGEVPTSTPLLIHFDYQLNDGPEPPTGNQIRLNNFANQSQSTEMYVRYLSNGDFDVRLFLIRLRPGLLIYLQDKNDSTTAQEFQITSQIIDNTLEGYVTVPIKWLSGAANLPAQAIVMIITDAPPVISPGSE